MRMIVLGLLAHGVIAGPMVCTLIGALMQSERPQPTYITRWRCFRTCGASRRQSALWVLGGVL